MSWWRPEPSTLTTKSARLFAGFYPVGELPTAKTSSFPSGDQDGCATSAENRLATPSRRCDPARTGPAGRRRSPGRSRHRAGQLALFDVTDAERTSAA